MSRGSARKARASRTRAPLTRSEIAELDAALLQAFQTIHNLRQTLVAAKHIKFPPLPPVFSESLVIVAAQRIFGEEWNARYGGKECDVVIQNAAGDTKRVEVKATAEHGFQEFKAKDLRADVLVWVHFGTRFQGGTGPIEITLLSQPGRVIDAPCRLDQSRFRTKIGADADVRMLRFARLEDLLNT